MPASLGTVEAFRVARMMHLAMLGLLLWVIYLFGLGITSYTGVGLVATLIHIAPRSPPIERGILPDQWPDLGNLLPVRRCRSNAQRIAIVEYRDVLLWI